MSRNRFLAVLLVTLIIQNGDTNSNRMLQLGHQRPWQNVLHRSSSADSKPRQDLVPPDHEPVQSRQVSRDDPADYDSLIESDPDSTSTTTATPFFPAYFTEPSAYTIRILPGPTLQPEIPADGCSAEALLAVLDQVQTLVSALSKIEQNLRTLLPPSETTAQSVQEPAAHSTSTRSAIIFPDDTSVTYDIQRAYQMEALNYTLKYISELPQSQQSIAYSALADLLSVSTAAYAEDELLQLTCQLRDQNLLDVLASNDRYNQYILPNFFQSETPFILVAKYGDYERAFYYTAHMNMGLSPKADVISDPNRFGQWVFVPIAGSCYFKLQETRSKEFLRSTTNGVLTVGNASQESQFGDLDYTYHWKLQLYQQFGEDAPTDPAILMENRATGLGFEWTSAGGVGLKTAVFNANQMWYQGRLN